MMIYTFSLLQKQKTLGENCLSSDKHSLYPPIPIPKPSTIIIYILCTVHNTKNIKNSYHKYLDGF